MIASKMNVALALEQALLKRQRHPFEPSRSSSWERETGKGYLHTFGEYRLKIQTNCHPEETAEVVIQEDCSSIATRVWDCAVLTTKWLEHRASQLADENGALNLGEALHLQVPVVDGSQQPPIQVLELGSGMGLLSICLAKMGAAVLSTEYGSAVAHLQRNCDRNQVTRNSDSSTSNDTSTLSPGRVVCRELDWYKTTETLQGLFPKEKDRPLFDLIAVTDCSLSFRDSQGVLDMIHKYGTPGHTKVLVGLCREREGTPYFIESAKKLYPQGVTTIPESEYPVNYQTARHTILLVQL
jgi:2-polyprenyl-3-methyl-5-hydroxy-6-metoxy-1,4-benzoquinol methylase